MVTLLVLAIVWILGTVLALALFAAAGRADRLGAAMVPARTGEQGSSRRRAA